MKRVDTNVVSLDAYRRDRGLPASRLPVEWATTDELADRVLEIAKETGDPDLVELFDKLGKRTCRLCGCTDDDCSQCIQKTGAPCYWVDIDLCSACAQQGATL